MKTNRYLWPIITITGLFLSGTFSIITLKIHKEYKANNPGTTLPESATCGKEGLVGHWKFDNIINGTTPDNSETNNTGKAQFWFHDLTKYIFGTPTLTKGVNGNCLVFRGRQWISGGNSNCYNTKKHTIAAWVWQQSDNMENRVIVPTIMAKSSWPYDGWWLCSTTKGIGKETRNREIDLGIAWGNGFTHIKSKYQLPLKEWHHIAVSMDNTLHEVQFYIDGKPYGKKHKNTPSWLPNWNHDLIIGGYDGSGRWPWHGKLDDVRFYNTILPSIQINTIFSSTKELHNYNTL